MDIRDGPLGSLPPMGTLPKRVTYSVQPKLWGSGYSFTVRSNEAQQAYDALFDTLSIQSTSSTLIWKCKGASKNSSNGHPLI